MPPASTAAAATTSSSSWNLVAADDPSDWRGEFAVLKSLDASLRCEMCYDIFTAPVAIKECNHTFCSACVRNAINQPGAEMGSRCPKCLNKNVYDSSLVPQPTLEHAAQQWRIARPFLYAQSTSASSSSSSSQHTSAPNKRAREDDREESESLRRSTRSASAARQSARPVVIDDSDSDSEGGKAAAKDYRAIQADDLAQCPMCMHTFTMRMLNVHLDKGLCRPDGPEPSAQERGVKSNGGSSQSGNFFRTSGQTTPSQPRQDKRKKLIRLNYDLCKPVDLKRSLEEWRLPTTGERKRMIDRHRKWVNLFNANLDAADKMRKSDATLRNELSEWERAQDVVSTTGMTKKKVESWADDHKDDFARLAAQARASHVRDKEKHG